MKKEGKLSTFQLSADFLPPSVGQKRILSYDEDGKIVDGGDFDFNTTIQDTHENIKIISDDSELVVGNKYIVLDYVTKHLIPNTSEIHTNIDEDENPIYEPLMLTAISVNSFHINAISIMYPNHEIEYRFDLDVCENDITPRPGMIISRRDTERASYVGCDYLGVVSRRWMILDKLYRIGQKIDDSNVTVTVPTNRPSLNNRTRYEIKFPEITHPEGQITLTLQYNDNTWIKPLVYHLDQEGGTIPANYLSEKSGTIIYNPELDSFVLMGFIDIGSELIGTYSSPISSGYSPGHSITFLVDSEDYEDVKIFQNNYNEVNIPCNRLALGTADYYPNSVFRNYVWRFTVGSYLNECTFLGGIHLWDIGKYLDNFILTGGLINELSIDLHASSVLYIPKVGNTNYVRHKYYYLEGVTISPVYNTELNVLSGVTYIVDTGSNHRVTSIISESNLFLKGDNIGVSVPNNLYITAPLYRCLIGYIDSRSLNINKTFNNQILFTRNNINHNGENILGYSGIDSINLKEFLTPVGAIKLMGRDETGQVVDASHLLDGITPPAEYTEPTINVSSNQISSGREVGETINAVLEAFFDQNDAGTITNIKFYKDNIEVYSEVNPVAPVDYTDVGILLSTTPIVYKATITYEEGLIKDDVLGNPSPEGHILAGSLESSPKNAVGTYILAFGATASIPTNSAEARALVTVVRGTTNVRTLDSGTTHTIQAILLPPGTSLVSVIDLDAAMQDLTIQYELEDNNFIINDANGDPVAAYSMYIRTQGTPYLTNHRHQFTIE